MRHRRTPAFTLLEILVAAAVLGITLLTVYPLFFTSQHLKIFSSYRIFAANFARETMELLRSKQLNDLRVGTGFDPILPESHFFNTKLNALRQFEIQDVFGTGFAGAELVGVEDTALRIEQAVGEGFRRRGKLIVVKVSWDSIDLGPGHRSEERLVLFRSNALPLQVFP
jgi:prepilin-type N-terminal cleavage/methylation domain-containing protein